MEEGRMNTFCIFHDREVERDGIFAGNCMECLEESAIRSAQNMGIPDFYYCGLCGNRCSREELEDHAKTKKCIIRLVKT